jgi:cysteine desulfurase
MQVYLDNAATTKIDEKVLEAMKPYFLEKYANASSLHEMGQEAKDAVDKARKFIAGFINANPDEIIFTSGGTESDNLALIGIAEALKSKGNHIITSKIEHPAVLETCRYLEEKGMKITYIGVDKYGVVNIEELKSAITDNTILASIMFANNEIGTIQPIAEIGKICAKKNIYFHTDAVQALGKVPIDVNAMGITMLSASAHKVHGPKGIGFLYVKKGTKIKPIIHGGGHEHGLRSGTTNTTGIIGFVKALELMNEPHEMEILRDKIIKELTKIPDSILNGHPTARLSNNVNISFKYIEGESMLLYLSDNGIFVSTGSACSSLSLKPSHVLSAIGLRPEDGHGSIRISLSRYTTEKEVDYAIEKIKEVVEKLRKLSPLGKR